MGVVGTLYMADIDIKEFLKEQASLVDKIIEKYIPRKYDDASLIRSAGKPRYAYNIEAPTESLAKPIWDMLSRGGKRWRPALFLLIIEALKGDLEKVKDFVIIPEVVHNGTLLIDDIEDDSKERRGEACTHIKYGVDITINAGNFMYYAPLLSVLRNTELKANTKLKVYDIYLQEMINLGFGQGMDIAWHRGLANADNITEKEYLQMCAYKTGCLARMSAKLAAVLAEGTEEQVEAIGKLAETVGIAFQIQDDILNLIESGVSKTKGGVGEDITEGKRTLMVIHTLANGVEEDSKRLVEILNMHTDNQSLRDEAIGIMKKNGSIEYSKEFARNLVKDSWGEVDALLEESDAKQKLKAFADFLIERDV